MTRTPTLILDHVTRIHHDGPHTFAALDDVSLELSPGELIAIMGPSGSGKSTLLNVAGTLDSPSSGKVMIDGTDVALMTNEKKAHLRRTRIGFVFQYYNLIDTLTVAENVALPLELDGVKHSEARTEALATLTAIGQEELENRFPAEISGGQRQRVAIARALIGTRSILLADEPTGALDTTTAEAVMGLIRDRIDQGACGLVVTHEPRFAAWADRTVYLRDGHTVNRTDLQ